MSPDTVGKKREIDWGDMRFVTWDHDGRCFGFKKRPRKGHLEWLCNSSGLFRLVELDHDGICADWDESLLDLRDEDSMKYIQALMEL